MKTIPSKDADFVVVADVIFNGANQHSTEWGLDTMWMNDLSTKAQKWNAAYQAYLNPSMRTPLITFEKNEARRAYEKSLRQLVLILQGSPKVTADDLRGLGIATLHPSRTPIPPPTTYPEFTVDTSLIRWLIIHFRNQGSFSNAKPKGVHGAKICWAILEAPPTGLKALSNSSFDTHTPFKLEFDDEQRGKTIYFCLQWENTKGEAGPWSEIVSAKIP